MAELNDTIQDELEDMSDSLAETPNVLVDEPPLSAENLSTDIQSLRMSKVKGLIFPSSDTKITDEILAQTNFTLETIPRVNITETNALNNATVRALQETVGKKGSRPQTPHNAWQQRLEKKIKRLRSDVNKLSGIAKGNATKNQEWQKKLRDTPATTAVEAAKQRVVAFAARQKRNNSENKARTINKLFSTDASKV